MPRLQIIAGVAGKGEATYEDGVLILPDGAIWYAEEIMDVMVLGGIDEPEHWSGRVLGGLKGGLSLASNLDLSPALSLASTVIGAGVGAMATEAKSRVVIEIAQTPQRTVVALAAPGVAALMIHDGMVCRRAQERRSRAEIVGELIVHNESLIDQSKRAIIGALDTLPSLTSVFGGIKGPKT